MAQSGSKQGAVTRAELLKTVSERTGMTRTEVEQVYEHTVRTIQDAVKSGRKVALTGFGRFTQRVQGARKAGMGKNPFTGETIKTAARPERRLPRFSPAKQFKEYVSGSLKLPALPASKPAAGPKKASRRHTPLEMYIVDSQPQKTTQADSDDELVELLARVLSRTISPGERHFVLSAAEIDARIEEMEGALAPGKAISQDVRRVLRNQLVHGVLDLNQAHLHGESLIDAVRAEITDVEEALSDLLSSTRSELESLREEEDWLHIADSVAESFLKSLLEDPTILRKIDRSDASRLGRAAAEQVISSSRWSQVVGERVDTATVTSLLGISRQALAKRQDAGSVLGLPGKGTTWYPTWQFDFDAKEVRPEVRDIIGAFRDQLDAIDPLLIASWAATPQVEDLDGLTPATWIREDRHPELLRIAAERAASRLAR